MALQKWHHANHFSARLAENPQHHVHRELTEIFPKLRAWLRYCTSSVVALQKCHDAKHFSAGLTENPKTMCTAKIWRIWFRLYKSVTVSNLFKRVERDFPKTTCMAKILHKYLHGFATVERSKTFFSRIDRELPKSYAQQRYCISSYLALQKCHSQKLFSTGLCMAKILHKCLAGSAKVHRPKRFSTGSCTAKILHKYLSGSAEVPGCKTFFTGVDRKLPKSCVQQRGCGTWRLNGADRQHMRHSETPPKQANPSRIPAHGGLGSSAGRSHGFNASKGSLPQPHGCRTDHARHHVASGKPQTSEKAAQSWAKDSALDDIWSCPGAHPPSG